jgi:ParB-like chromosome segregation protein Spo0J
MSANGSGPNPSTEVEGGARGSDQLGSRIGPEDNRAPSTNQDELRFHPLADIFPLMGGAEFDELVADIKANGLNEPIITHQGMILDGRNRYRACIAAGCDLRLEIMAADGWIDDPAAYVISANIRRRHLTGEQKRDLIAKLVKAQPEKSDREIAKIAKVDHKTVGAARAEMEATGEIPQLKRTVGADGKARKRPVKKVEAPTNALKKAVGTAEAVNDAGRRIVGAVFAPEDKLPDLTAAEVERLATRLLANDRKSAAEIYSILTFDDRRAIKVLISALGRGLGPDDTAPPAEPLSGDDPGPIPDCLRRDRRPS